MISWERSKSLTVCLCICFVRRYCSDVSLRASIYVCMCVCMCICMCMYVCMYACMYVCMYVYVCLYVCVSVCMYALYVYVHVNTHMCIRVGSCISPPPSLSRILSFPLNHSLTHSQAHSCLLVRAPTNTEHGVPYAKEHLSHTQIQTHLSCNARSIYTQLWTESILLLKHKLNKKKNWAESILLLKHKLNNILQTASSVPGELVQLTLSDILYLRSKDSSSSGAAGSAGSGKKTMVWCSWLGVVSRSWRVRCWPSERHSMLWTICVRFIRLSSASHTYPSGRWMPPHS